MSSAEEQLRNDLKEVEPLNEPFLALRDLGWLTLEKWNTLEVLSLPEDPNHIYIRVAD